MRAVCAVLAAIGGCALAAAVAIELAPGNPAGGGWVLVGPGPFYAVGLICVLRRPGHRVAAWLLASGAMFMLRCASATCCAAGLVHGWLVRLAGAGRSGGRRATPSSWPGSG